MRSRVVRRARQLDLAGGTGFGPAYTPPARSAPEATVAALLAVGSKPGGSFKHVDKATYTLADDLAEPASAKPKKPEAKPA